MNANGSGTNLFALDLDVDAGSGLPLASRDGARVETSYQFDAMGRLTATRPAEDAWTESLWHPADPASGARAEVEVKVRAHGATSGPTLEAVVDRLQAHSALGGAPRRLPLHLLPLGR